MSDLFHPDIPDEFRDQVFDTMERADWHTFQVLTKRVGVCMRYLNMRYFPSCGFWGEKRKITNGLPGNIWTGFTAWDQESYDDGLWEIVSIKKPAVLYCSLEPLLGPVRIETSDLDWIIIGGESGPGARPMDEAWVRDIITDCKRLNIPVFYKQRTVNGKKISIPEIDGKVYAEYPIHKAERR